MRVADQPLWSSEQITTRIEELGHQITHDNEGRELSVVGLLKGSFIFMADLVREIRRPVRCGFIEINSCPRGDRLTELTFTSKFDMEGADVLLVEDVLDTGITTAYLHQQIQSRGTRSIKVAALVDKPSRRRVDFHADYVGFEVPERYIVGYGLDYQGAYRNLPYLTYVT